MSRARILADYVSSGDELADKLDLSGGAMTGAITTNSTFDGVDVGVRDAILTSTTTLATAAAPKASPAFTGTPTGITAAHLEAGVLPSDVTGGTGLTAIAGVTTGSGDVTITSGSLIIPTADDGISFTGGTDPDTSGSATANILDDYEEGTFTPVCGNVGFTSATGNYTRIGNSVHVSMNGAWATSGTPTNISGLPFTLSSRACMGIIAMNRVDTVSVAPFAYCPGTQTYFYIWSVHDNTYWGDAISTVSSVGEITMTVTYQV